MSHRKTLPLLLALTPALASSVMGCEETGIVHDDAGSIAEDDAYLEPGTDAWIDPTIDSGPRPVTQLSYMPEGCSFTVTTPEVGDARRSEDVFGATPSVDHVHVSFAGDADTTLAMNWRSDVDTLASSVLIGTDEAAVMAADDAASGVTRHDGHTMRYAPRSGTPVTRVHEAHVCGLVAGTRYYYKVGGPGHWSDVYSVATSPTIGTTEAWSFAATGDSRGNEENAWAIAQEHVLARGVALQVFSGDAVALGNVQEQWNEEFFGPSNGTFQMSDSLAQIPLMMANGNHDLLATNYLAQFAFPQEQSEGESAAGEEWYSFDYGNAHFVFLNDTVFMPAVIAGAERAWLEADLRAADANRANVPWIFVVHHKPLYTCLSNHSANIDLRTAWQPLFDQYHVDMVIAGHNHVYERSRPIYGLTGVEGNVAATEGSNYEPRVVGGVPSGTVYVVAAGVGAPLYRVGTDCSTATPAGQPVRNYMVIDVEDRTLHARVFRALDDMQIDEFGWTK
jgi:hypothetical protein